MSTSDQIKVGSVSGEGIAIGRDARVEINRYTEIIIRPDSLEDVPPASGEQPYKGLSYFTEEDAHNFFGREEMSNTIATNLLKTRFLAVVGASGSGKSSLLRAGVVPRLRKQNWLIQIMTPTARPLQRLANVLTGEGSSLWAADELEAELASNPRTLHLAANRLAGQAGATNMLLVIDQLEELFTLCGDESERKAFLDNVLAAADEEGAITILIGLRADFYGHTAQYDDLRALVSQRQELIGPMRQEDLVRVIAEPAKRGGWQFVEGLVEQILEDAGGEPGQLPLLSHALLETWELRRGSVMTLGGYRASGGVEGAIAKTAEATLQRMDREQTQIVKHIFLSLTDLSESSEDTRRIATIAELQRIAADKSAVNTVIEELVRARLITVDGDQVQVAHEALIRRWPRLRSWIDEDRERLSFNRRLTRAAQEWEENDRQTDYLFRGSQLEQAESRIEEYKKWGLSEQQEVFIAASQEAAALAELEEGKIEEYGRLAALRTYVLAVAGGAVGLGIAAILIVFVMPFIDPDNNFASDSAFIFLILAVVFGVFASLFYVVVSDLLVSLVVQRNQLLSWIVAVFSGIVAFVLAAVPFFAFFNVDWANVLMMGSVWGGFAGAGRFWILRSERPIQVTMPLVTLISGAAFTLMYVLLKRFGSLEAPYPSLLVLVIGMLVPLAILTAEYLARRSGSRRR